MNLILIIINIDCYNFRKMFSKTFLTRAFLQMQQPLCRTPSRALPTHLHRQTLPDIDLGATTGEVREWYVRPGQQVDLVSLHSLLKLVI